MYFTRRILLFLLVLYMGKVSVRAANEGSSSGSSSSSSSGGEIDTECVFEYTSTLISQGEVVSPNYPSSYPNNLNCRYEFYARENERVIIQVEDFELEPAQNTAMQEINFMDFIETVTRPSTNQRPQPQQANEVQQPDNASERDDSSLNKQCFYDFLDVFSSDGIGHLYWMARYCGRDIQTQIVSTSPTLILVFKTDRMLAFRGFKLRFHFSYLNILPFVTDSDRCGHAEISGNGSVLHSPNYPRAYPPEHIECAWTITVDKSKKILVKFIDVNFGSESCSQSYVSIWDGYVSDVHKPQFTVCQKLVYYHKGVMKFESKSNRIVIKFVGNRFLGNQNQDEDLFWSNGSRKIENIDEIKTGFLFSWTAVNVEEECSPNDFQCEGGEYCIDSKNFLCQQTQRYCVSRSLVCDGVFNCDIGDESDEKNCEMNYLRSKHYLFAVSISFTLFLLLTIVYCMIRFWRRKCLDETNGKFMEAKKMENGAEFNLLNGMPEPHFVKFSKNSLPLETTGATTLAEATTSSSTTIQSENEQDDEKSIGRKRAPTPIRTPSKHEAKPLNTRKTIDAKDDEDEEDEDDQDNVDEDLENEVALIRREYRVKQLIEQNVMGNPAKTTPKKPQLYHQHSLQINHVQQNHSHHHQPQRNSIAFTRQSTTPTYSSSLQSDNNSLSSPGAPLVPRSMCHQPTPPLSHHHTHHHHHHHPLHHQSSLQSPSRSAAANQDTDVIIINGGTPLKRQQQQTTPSRFSAIAEKNKLHLVDESNNSLRRNSYTKAIFYENEERI